MHGIRHVLDPGTPGYAALKLSAVAGFAGLQFALRRRSRSTRDDGGPVADADLAQEQRRSPHPRSRKKKRRRRA